MVGDGEQQVNGARSGAVRTIGPIRLPLRVDDGILQCELRYYEYDDGRWVAVYPPASIATAGVPLRIESACFFGHVLHSATCDCGYQLHEALRRIRRHGRGVLIFAVDQDARGLGLGAHFAIYRMRQFENADTPEVYRRLDSPVDARTYEPVLDILRDLEISSVCLMSNNPGRIAFLRRNGIAVTTEPLEAPLDDHNMSTLMLEKEDLGYLWSFSTHGDWLRIIQGRTSGVDDVHAVAVGDDDRMLFETSSRDGDIARRVAEHVQRLAGEVAVRALYLTDLPRTDEIEEYARLKLKRVVVPFADIPAWCRTAGESAGVTIQDWGRDNAYAQPRPQWALVEVRDDGTSVYRRGDEQLLVPPSSHVS